MKLLAPVLLLVAGFQSAVPVGEEPRHHVKFQNEYVRVIDASVPVGDATLFHTHLLDNIPVVISGGKLRTEPKGGVTRDSSVVTGGISFAAGSYTHRITNIGDTPLRFIDAEILSSPGSPANVTSLERIPGHTLEMENQRVRIYRILLDPGQSTGKHTHQLSGLSVAVSGGKVAIEQGGETEIAEFKPGDFRWHSGSRIHSLRNVGKTRFEAFDIEWK
jgi:mannose-6-phosphate isomerase-like protein (cupin superfamily)